MIIRELQCDQFAGVNDREYVFSDGINLLVGANESGKSTMVDLLYFMLFQNSKLDKRSDKDFIAKYFPNTIGDYQGDTIDGKMSFETNSGRFTIIRRWMKNNVAFQMKLPDGTITADPERIRQILENVLIYHKGVYDELVFSSQRRISGLLDGLLGTSNGNVDSIASEISKSVMETGGIDIDAIKKNIEEKLASYDSNWDVSLNLPKGGTKRGISNPWKQSVGEILQAYYKKESLQSEKDSAIKKEEEISNCNTQIERRTSKREETSDKLMEFSNCIGALKTYKTNETLLSNYMKEFQEQTDVLENWPCDVEKLERATRLKEEQDLASLKRKYEVSKPLVEDIERYKKELENIGDISIEDVKSADEISNEIRELEVKVSGVNISAKITSYGNNAVSVISSISGENVPDNNGVYNITESVKICIPGIADIQLAPEGVDVESVERKIVSLRSQLSVIFAKCNVDSLKALHDKRQSFERITSQKEQAEYRMGPDVDDWDSLTEKVAGLPDSVRDFNLVSDEIEMLCGEETIGEFIAGLNSGIQQYKNKYESIEKLQNTNGILCEKIKKLTNEIEAIANIPEEYKSIDNVDEYKNNLSSLINHYNVQIGELQERKADILKGLGDKTVEELTDECEVAEQDFQSKLNEYAHWRKIKAAFDAVLERFKGNPFHDVECYFRENLEFLSNGRLKLNSVEDKLGSDISSGKNKLKAGILSEGTKDTISLAFRLAVLKYLFPNGGGLAVFDDPFTDMDPERTKQACKLIQEFAENNQVIFVTCDNKYTNMLTGNVISVAD